METIVRRIGLVAVSYTHLSTAIVFKAFNDMGLLQQKFTGIVLGILVIEDLVAVVMMVCLLYTSNRICHDGGCVVINEMKRDTH